MNKENFSYHLVKKNDVEAIAKFMNYENKNKKIDSAYINWWYFEKKISGNSFFSTKLNNELVGISTINNFSFNLDNDFLEIGMPQNVLTSHKYRGRGLFAKVFTRCEEFSLKNNINTFITFKAWQKWKYGNIITNFKIFYILSN